MRICLTIAFTATAALAAGAPENTLIVVNGDSWASLWIANEYAAVREIPGRNVVVLHELPSFERIGVNDFRRKILLPALKAAEDRGIAPTLDYVLYSADLPWAIDPTDDLGGRKLSPPITQPASLTGLTYLYQLTLGKNPEYLGLNTNFYFRPVSRVAPEKPWPAAETKRYKEALTSLREVCERIEGAGSKPKTTPAPNGDRVAAPGPSDEDTAQLKSVLKTLRILLADHPTTTELLYNIACVNARLGNGDDAIASLRQAMDNGWWDMRHAQRDADFRSLWGRADFKALVAEAKNVKFEMTPPSGFRGSIGWTPNGAPVPSGKGVHYLLSTMLACTSGRGTSAREAVTNLMRSAGADSTFPKGTVYFMENNDVRSNTREWGFARAAEKLRSIGVNALVEPGILPVDKRDVAGGVIGTADFDWTKSGSRIAPGAIVEHFTSFGGVMNEGAGQTALTEFIRHGAAGASGTVTEPYAIQAKFPSPFIQWFYAQGSTLAEAFYQSVAGPYQLLIVGDALCAPWKKRLNVSLEGAKPGQTLRGEVKLKPGFTSPDGLVAGIYEAYLDGGRVAGVKHGDKFTFDTAKFDDGHHELTIIATATDALATTGRITIPIVTRNSDLEPVVTTNATGDWPWDKPVTFTAKAPGAKAIALSHHGETIAVIPDGKATASVDPRTLGQGPVTIIPVATYAGGQRVLAAPIKFQIQPPAPLPAKTLPDGKTLAPGLRVIPAGLPAAVAEKTDGDWLAKAGVPADGEFSVEGWFNVPSADVYQFQLRGPETLRLFVDDKAQDWPRGKEWWFVPVHLSAGIHKVRIEGKANGKPVLEARFGGPGAYKLAAPRFQHL